MNAVCPGIVMTPHHDTLIADMAKAAGVSHAQALAEFYKLVPQGRPQTAADVANMVLYLASDLAANMTGGSYHIDGGTMMC